MAVLPPIPSDEHERVAALRRLTLLDSPADPACQALVELTARVLRTPVAAINLVDADRRWTKAGVGCDHGDAEPRDSSFCAHVVGGDDDPWVVTDAAADPRFADHALVTAGRVGFYAGAPVRTPGGHKIGTLCVMDSQPRAMDEDARDLLRALAALVSVHVEREREREQETVARLAEHSRADALTGVLNRRALDDELHLALLNARGDLTAVAVAILDLDHFKAYNDTYGHTAGDSLLKASCASWSSQLRSGDVLARYGGEEFVVLLPGCALADAHALVDRLRRCTPSGQTCSAGVAGWDGDEPVSELLERAGQALRRAKAQGRDVVCVSA
ncbi:MAG TPA: sensor domain-containing diguanylate cyclase [Baekduia sp.]|uniref:GGDEF domain-containing protein n=1 Tax=Baekduia sp. TaxID=2600305 RepID=UPI002D0D0A13|nr:sensor domain-containing diguanylate cyclase [Baekduia sp.]HMJ33205.1 sensor domain-containing diguanylate cyclase [Baekduia sp.]